MRIVQRKILTNGLISIKKSEKTFNLGKYFNYGVDQELKKIVESNKNLHIAT